MDGSYTELQRENALLKSQLALLGQEQENWKVLALENERLLLAERQTCNTVEIAKERATFLAKANNHLTASLNYKLILDNLVREIVPSFADWCMIDLLLQDNAEQEPYFARTVVAHRDQSKEDFLIQVYRYYPLNLQGSHPIAHVVRSQQAVLEVASKNKNGFQQSNDNDYQDFLVSSKHSSYMLLPIIAGGQVLGVVSFVRAFDTTKVYDNDDLRLMEDLCTRIGLVIQNARLYDTSQEALKTRNELDYYKDLYLAMVSHELRNPLATVRGYSQLVKRGLTKVSPPYTKLKVVGGGQF